MVYIITLRYGRTDSVTGRGGQYGCETSRLPHFIDKRFTDGGEVVSLKRQSDFPTKKDSYYSFLLKGKSNPGT
jgi:hypothetical protein